MRIKQEDIIIDDTNPFQNCKLNRKKYADILTNIVDTYSDGFVLAINNEWGTGKTTFVKMWQRYLQNQEYQTLYFNAWENDFDNNPLVALMAELKSFKNDDNKVIFESLVKKGAVITKNVLPALIKAIAAKYIDKEVLKDAIENITKAATEILNDEIKEYTSKKDGLVEFKKKLEEFVKKVAGEKPIIFIIDELDRCRPNYAVKVLEQVKHFFSVKGIVFVLSIDKEQLGNAVRGLYGSERINAEEYLRRFIDLEYVLEPPNTEIFCKYLFEYFQLDSFFESEQRKSFDELKGDKELLLKVASPTFKSANLSLRQQEKIFAHTRIVLNAFKFNSFVFPSLLVILIFIRTHHKEFYMRIKLKQLDIDSLLEDFVKVIPKKIEENEMRYFTHLEANLIYMYTNSIYENFRVELFKKDEDGKEICMIKSKINKIDNRLFSNQLKYFIENWSMNNTKIEYLLSRIDLTENFEL